MEVTLPMAEVEPQPQQHWWVWLRFRLHYLPIYSIHFNFYFLLLVWFHLKGYREESSRELNTFSVYIAIKMEDPSLQYIVPNKYGTNKWLISVRVLNKRRKISVLELKGWLIHMCFIQSCFYSTIDSAHRT